MEFQPQNFKFTSVVVVFVLDSVKTFVALTGILQQL